MKVRGLTADELAEAAFGGRDFTPIVRIRMHATTGSRRLTETCGVSETGWRLASAKDKARILGQIARALDALTAEALRVRKEEGITLSEKITEAEDATI